MHSPYQPLLPEFSQNLPNKYICQTNQQLALLKLLTSNAAKLPKRYKKKKTDAIQPMRTFFLPIGLVNSITIGELSKENACAVCGKSTKMRCKDCLGEPDPSI